MNMNVALLVRFVDQLSQPFDTAVDKVGRGFDNLQKRAAAFKKGFGSPVKDLFTGDNFDEQLNYYDDKINRARGRLMGAAGRVLTLAVPIKLAAGFDQSFKGVEKVVDAPIKRLKQLRQFALNTSALVPVAAKNVLEIISNAAQRGIPIKNLERFSLFTAKAKVAFEMAAGAIAKRFAELRNVYKLNQDGLEDLGNAFNHLSNKFSADADQISNFVNRAAGAAVTLKATAVEMTAIGTALIASGIVPETAARGVNAFTNNIVEGGKKVNAAFKLIGTSREAFLKELDKDGAEAFVRLFERLAKSKDGQKALLGLVGKDFGDDFAKLLNNTKLLRETMAAVANKADRKNSVGDEAAKQAEGAEKKFELLKNKLVRVAIVLGTHLLPPLIELTDRLGVVIDQVAAFADANPELFSSLIQVAAGMLLFGAATRVLGFAWAVTGKQMFKAIGLFYRFNAAGKNISFFGRMLPRLKGGSAIFGRLARSAAFFLGSISPNKIKGALVGLRMLSTFGKGAALQTMFIALRTVAISAFAGIAAAGWPVTLVVLAIAAAVFLAWKYWDRFSSFVTGVGSGLYDALVPDLAPIKAAWSELSNLVRDAVGRITDSLGFDGQAAMAAFDRMFDFSGVIQKLETLKQAVGNFFRNLFSQETLNDGQKAQIEATGRRVGEMLGNALKISLKGLTGLGPAIVRAILTGLDGAWGQLTSWFDAKWAELTKKLTFDISLPSWLGGSGNTPKTAPGSPPKPAPMPIGSNTRPIGGMSAAKNTAASGSTFGNLFDDGKKAGSAIEQGGDAAARKITDAGGSAGEQLGAKAAQRIKSEAATAGDIFGQRAASHISRVTANIKVNTTTTAGQRRPVAKAKAGALHDGVDE